MFVELFYEIFIFTECIILVSKRNISKPFIVNYSYLTSNTKNKSN